MTKRRVVTRSLSLAVMTPSHTLVHRPSPTHSTPGRSDPTWLAVTLAIAAVAWGGNQFTPLLLMYQRVAGFDEFTVRLLLFAYVIGLVPSLMGAPWLGRKWGRRNALLAAVAVSAAGSILMAIDAASVPLVFIGRTLIGLALGIGMVLGRTWLHDLLGGRDGSVRSAMSLTVGFALGPALAGALAQWAAMPTVLPYALHVLVCIAGFVPLARVKSRGWEAAQAKPQRVFPLPSAFIWRVVPAAPLIFGSLGIAYAVLPALVARATGDYATAYSALLCLVTLGVGFLAQTIVGKRASNWARRFARLWGVAIIAAGIASSAIAAATGSPVIALSLSVILGAGYGLLLIGSLLETEDVATHAQLPILTSIMYSLAYVGFGIPMVLSWFTGASGVDYAWTLGMLGLICAIVPFLGAAGYRVINRRRSL